MYVCMYVYTYHTMYVCMYVCMYVYVHTYVCICMYVAVAELGGGALGAEAPPL